MINICVPVLKRYDLLRKLVVSLSASSVPVGMIHILDNGRRGNRLHKAMETMGIPFTIIEPPTPLGVADSWNLFITTVPEERIIVNDDITFAPDSIAKLIASNADIIWAKDCGFSCFVLRDRCVEKIGLFDPEISPGYAYYEDDDYLQRLDGRGTRAPSAVAANVDCGVQHFKSATLKTNTPAEMAEHHRKFKIAQGNYIRKWGLEEEFERERMQREAIR